MVTTSCVLNAPRCVTTVPRVRLHGSRGGVFVDHRPPRDPGDSLHIYITRNRSFTSIQMCHTHTHPAFGRVVRRKMRWRWGWGGSEGEMTLKMRWKLLNQDAKRGTQKKKERTPTRHTWPGAGKPWKGKGKEKRRVDGHGTRPAEGGEGRKRLNQPDKARTYTHLSTRRSRPTWGGRTREIGDQWGLVGEHTKIKTGFSS